MIEQIENMIQARIKEVLQYHLRGSAEEFEAASKGVMEELTFMGGSLQNVVGFTGLDVTTAEGRTELAGEFLKTLKEGN